MGEYATKGELNELKKEMYEGFDKVTDTISNLASNTEKGFSSLSENITNVISKSMSSDFNIRADMMSEIEHKENERRISNTKTLTIIIGLITIAWGAVWWSFNEHDDKKRIADKLEICNKLHHEEIVNINKFHEHEKRIMTLELKSNITPH